MTSEASKQDAILNFQAMTEVLNSTTAVKYLTFNDWDISVLV
jgi:hypothetical protein